MYTQEDWNDINADSSSSRLLNRATQGLYPPGSIFKVVTALAYWEQFHTLEKFHFDCDGELTKGGFTIHCYKGNSHGEEDFYKAFAKSCNTAFAQMAAEVLGINYKDVHVISTQDTDITPFGLGAYASRQTYVGGFAIHQTASMMKDRILNYAHELTRMQTSILDLKDGKIIRTTDGRELMTLGELATEVLYSLEHSRHITSESTYQIKTNAYSFGCSFAEVEVDIPLCKVKLLKMINVHDCGRLINPQLAEAQVHGGMSMAIGYGMSEQLLFDEKTGKPLNNNLLDYKLSTTMDHPDLAAAFIENFEPTSPFGTKALGEPPACPGAPAIRNAVLNATGVSVNKAPLSPHILFERFKEEGLI